MTIPQFQKTILSWQKENRRDFPWRRTKNPYKILVSEFMLQQTQTSRVKPKYQEFLKQFPTVKSLSAASDKKLLKTWEGLGYWRRAIFLRETARIIKKRYKGRFPKSEKDFESMPGIGPYTARALLCFAFQNQQPFLDTNIRRVYLQYFFPKRKRVSDKEILKIAKKAVLKKDPRKWHYALFDFGAVKINKRINRKSLHYVKQKPFEGSFRSFRTKALKAVLSKGRIPHKKLESFLKKEVKKAYLPNDVISSLLKDKLIKKSGSHYFV
ncbi:A/G-specific adenine glycosylase [Patescibacteria group bacterium]